MPPGSICNTNSQVCNNQNHPSGGPLRATLLYNAVAKVASPSTIHNLRIFVSPVRILVVTVTAGVALAVTKTCNGVPCNGTDNEDVLHERNGSVHDRILAYDDNDLPDANNAFNERDVLKGGSGRDKLLANDRDGRDILKGGAGRDRCYDDRGDPFVSCNVRSTRAADFTGDVE